MNLRDVLDNEILARVEKPSRYLGNELNSTRKNPEDVELRICFFFPDLYELGLGNLGLHILYAQMNRLDWVWAERGYTPGPDMEAILRERGLPLFMLESKDPLTSADMIGFTLQSELTFTNIINALDLAGLPIRSAQRDDSMPLIFAGGPAVFNPEPIAPFIDFFVIGDGEDAMMEIAETMRGLKGVSRREQLEAMALLEGVYVPELYPFETMPDGQILPKEDAPKIVKRLVKDMDGASFPTNYIVPNAALVHDGAGLEVLRGCTQGCRFCQAGMVTRPVRERSIENIDKLMEQTLENTGFDAVSLISLSTCDFSMPRTLVKMAAERGHKDNVSISLPSLRLDSYAVELSDMVAGVRRSGLTFAPEAATPRMRAVINKFIPDEELLHMSAEAYGRGWDHVKTYFMIGLPTERDEDVEAIADLAIRTVREGKQINPRAAVRTGVSTFIPKPFTPFQWAEQISIEETHRRQEILFQKFRGQHGIKFGRHDPKTSFIEGLLSRADRRAADLIEAAWKNGARLETWEEHVNFAAWEKAVADVDYDVAGQFRERDVNERLPWDHIDILIPKDWFQKDWRNAMELKYAQDCRAGKCHLCGVIYRERELCKTMLKRQKAGHQQEEATWEGYTPAFTEQPDPVQRVRFRIGRSGEARFLSHLELKDAWFRALRRAKAPIAYTQGFHAQPRVTFSTACPVGEASRGDYMDVMLKEYVDEEALYARLQERVPPGLHVFAYESLPLRGESLMSLVDGFEYSLRTVAAPADLRERVAALLAQEEILVERKVKQRKPKKGRGWKRREKTTAEIDIRPMLESLAVTRQDGAHAVLSFATRDENGRLAKPKDIMALLGLPPEHTQVTKENTLLREERARALA
ncbi:MAG: TIGR03960 family B12-binding radical SAM protein [Candidatus Hydrogenedentes bacterium]|nr:TIGR03960 family B12-binding radical SAM protein [Candidatus Hydrogenedentota bacterium]